MSKIFYRISDFREGIETLKEKGVQAGEHVGFECTKDLLTFKLGYTTYFVGSPYSGKSTVLFEFLVNLSEFYGWRHAIFSPESGSKEEIVAELAAIVRQKPFFNTYGTGMSDDELGRALSFLNDYFFIIDPQDKDLTIPEFYETVELIEKEYDVKIHTTTGDPFNEFKHDFSKDEGRQDLYIERVLGDVRKNAAKHNRHNIIVTHCRDQQAITKDNVTFFPPPTARDYAGGQAWFRKGMQMLCVWRPPFGLQDETGRPYEDNETHIIIQKSKPKGIGKKGVAVLYFDYRRSRFYEKVAGSDCYARKEFVYNRPIRPIEDWTEPNKDKDEYPF